MEVEQATAAFLLLSDLSMDERRYVTFLQWVLRHGDDDPEGKFCPEVREQKHLEWRGKITTAMEEEWAAIQRYFRDVVQADRDRDWALHRAGERYLLAVQRLRQR